MHTQTKVFQISDKIGNAAQMTASENETEPALIRPNWKSTLITLGFMNDKKDDSNVNGTAIFFAVAFALVIIYNLCGGTANFLFKVDEKLQQDALQKTSGRRLEDKFNREQEKRAQTLDYIKEKGLYDAMPENLKTFESAEADRMKESVTATNVNKPTP